MDEDEFRQTFHGSPAKRTKWRGLLRNVCVAIGNLGLVPDQQTYDEIVERLAALAASGDDVLAEHARWALNRIRLGNLSV